MKLKVKQKYLIKTKVISYNLYEIKYFTYFIEEEYGHFKIIYNDKEEEIFKLLGDYPEIYKSLENILNEKLQKITQRNISNNLN